MISALPFGKFGDKESGQLPPSRLLRQLQFTPSFEEHSFRIVCCVKSAVLLQSPDCFEYRFGVLREQDRSQYRTRTDTTHQQRWKASVLPVRSYPTLGERGFFGIFGCPHASM